MVARKKKNYRRLSSLESAVVEDKQQVLQRLYTSADSDACFSSAERLYQAARAEDERTTRRDVQHFLRGQRTYTLHRRIVRRFPRLRTVPAGLHTDWQADLADFDALHTANDGYRYLLVCVDVLSRNLFVEPVRTKRSVDMISAFEALLARAGVQPWKIVHDAGLEFTAAAMSRFFKAKEIESLCTFAHPSVHAGVVERANRTIKERIYRYFSERNTTRWVDVVQRIVAAINRSVCRSTGLTPSQVTFANANELRRRLYGSESAVTRPALAVGDYVRIEKRKQEFEKGYLPRFTDELFIITKARVTNPPTYALKDEVGEAVRGWFYGSELCPVRKDASTTYRVERVLKSRRSKRGGTEHFVKWLNRPSIYNAWVHESDFVC